MSMADELSTQSSALTGLVGYFNGEGSGQRSAANQESPEASNSVYSPAPVETFADDADTHFHPYPQDELQPPTSGMMH